MTTHKVLLNKLNVPLALQILLLAHLQNLMLDLLSQSTPPSASPDCKLAHISVIYSVVSARYRHVFCVMLGLRLRYQLFYSLYSEAYLERVGFGELRY